MGPADHAVRSESWRYIRYSNGAEELYNHTTDPFEWVNLVGAPQYEGVCTELARNIPGCIVPDDATLCHAVYAPLLQR